METTRYVVELRQLAERLRRSDPVSADRCLHAAAILEGVTIVDKTERVEHVGPPLVSIMKAGEIAGVSRRTIYSWLASGKISYKRTASGTVRIYRDSLWKVKPDG